MIIVLLPSSPPLSFPCTAWMCFRRGLVVVVVVDDYHGNVMLCALLLVGVFGGGCEFMTQGLIPVRYEE
jgi:hypothetical protein